MNNFIKTSATLLSGVLFMAIFVGSSFIMTVPADAKCVKWVKSWDKLWIRSGPGTRFRKKRGIPANACGVSVLGHCKGKWCKVRFRGTTGYTNTNYLHKKGTYTSELNWNGKRCKKLRYLCNKKNSAWACRKEEELCNPN